MAYATLPIPSFFKSRAIEDLWTEIQARDPSLARKIYLLEDCTSPVVIPDVLDYTTPADRAFQKFADAPYLDIVYKLVQLGKRPIRKLSSNKVTLAGRKQVFRFDDPNGVFLEDIIACREETRATGKPLLEPVMINGQRYKPEATLMDICKHFVKQFGCLDPRYKTINTYIGYPVRLSAHLKALQK